mmetsp:Transcript_29007/g.63871  ORF Transcript_29007/g.63871 Transcript_29007/m.63871 type:complete len:95 (+) Transcript_29007:636-920(+)
MHPQHTLAFVPWWRFECQVKLHSIYRFASFFLSPFGPLGMCGFFKWRGSGMRPVASTAAAQTCHALPLVTAASACLEGERATGADDSAPRSLKS